MDNEPFAEPREGNDELDEEKDEEYI